MSKTSPNPRLVKRRPHLICCIIATVMLLVACKRNHPPTPPDVTGLLVSRPRDTAEFSATSTDRDDDLISYLFAWGDTSSATWSADYPSGVTVSKGHMYADSGAYAVRARARDDKGAESDWSPTETLQVGSFPPGTPTRPAGPATGLTGVAYEYSTRATSPYGESLRLRYDWGDREGTWSDPVASDSPFVQRHTFDTTGTYRVRAKSMDRLGTESAWSECITMTVSSEAPTVPTRPNGPDVVKVDSTVFYTTSSVDPNADSVRYFLDWGDGAVDTSGFLASGEATTSGHAWNDCGTFSVRARAQDQDGNLSYAWSDPLVVTVDSVGYVNHPPDAPVRPTHVGIDSVGKPIAFATSATDDDGDSVQIKFYFGEGGAPGYGPKVASGAPFRDTVVYHTNGWKVVYAVATDGRDTSTWSEPDSVYINSPNVPPGAPQLLTELTPKRGVAGGPAYRFYARASDQYGDSLYYRFYFDDNDSVTTELFPSGADGYALWAPALDVHLYAVRVRVFDAAGLPNDTMPTTTFQTVGEGQIIWGVTAEFVASPAIGAAVWRGTTWPAIICGSTDELLYVFDAYQSFLVNTIVVPGPREYNSSPTVGPDGTRYVGNENGGFYAIGPDDSIKWRFGTGDSGMTATAALGYDHSIYCGGEDRRIHKLIDNGTSASEA